MNPTINQLLKRLGLIVVAVAFRCEAQLSLQALPQLAAVVAPKPDPNLVSLSFAWSHPADTNVVGYSVSFGTNLNALNNSVGVGYVTNVTVSGLQPSFTYYFQAFSLNSAGVMSEPSNTVTNFIQPLWKSYGYVSAFSTPLVAGRTNIIQSSTNGGVTWRNIHTNTTGGSYTALRTNSAMATSEFFRIKP